MRHHLIARSLVIVGAVTTPALVSADAAPCRVTIVRAPDDVRATIETWVAAETRCGRALEVRIVATDGGLYVVARDDRGRLHERIVPNADSAGVLIASWAADDRMPGQDRQPAPSDRWADQTTRELEAARPESRVAPGDAEVTAITRPTTTATTATTATGPTRWLSLGGMLGMSDGGGSGVRASSIWLRKAPGRLGSESPPRPACCRR